MKPEYKVGDKVIVTLDGKKYYGTVAIVYTDSVVEPHYEIKEQYGATLFCLENKLKLFVAVEDQIEHGLDSEFKEVSDLEWRYHREAVNDVLKEAATNAHKRPKMTTLIEEFSELVLSLRGKHDDPPEVELKQVASVAINLLWQMKMGQDINNIVTFKEK